MCVGGSPGSSMECLTGLPGKMTDIQANVTMGPSPKTIEICANKIQ